MRALLLDIGNSRIKWGIYDGRKIRETGDIPQADIAARGLSVLTARLPLEVDTVYASNVAGTGFAARLKVVVELHSHAEVHFARVAKEAHGVTNSYGQPRRMGVDRWVAMIGAWAEHGSACLVVDAGTAVTIDAIDDAGRHLGGQILPGIGLMAKALAGETAGIPLFKSGARPGASRLDIFGTTTSAAVGLGTLGAVTGAIERAARTLGEHDLAPVIVLTGGDASRILGALDEPAVHRPHLVLSGLAHMLEDR